MVPVNASVIYQIPWICWIHWKFRPLHLGKTLIQTKRFSNLLFYCVTALWNLAMPTFTCVVNKTAKNKSQSFQEPKLWDMLTKDKLVTCTKRNPIKLITNQYINLRNTITQGVEIKLLQHTCMNHALLFIPNLPNCYVKLPILLTHNTRKLKLLCRIMQIG